MSIRLRVPRAPRQLRRASRGALAVWVIALVVAFVGTVQIRSQAEVQRTLVGVDSTSLAFLIDDLHRANETLSAESADLVQRRDLLKSGNGTAADAALEDEATQLRDLEGLAPVQGPGVVIVIDARGLTGLDLQDALNNLGLGGAEAIAINDQRVVVGVPVRDVNGQVTVDGASVSAPWTITVVGDANRLAETADLMTKQLRADRRVRQATYRVEGTVVIRAVAKARPFVYGSTP